MLLLKARATNDSNIFNDSSSQNNSNKRVTSNSPLVGISKSGSFVEMVQNVPNSTKILDSCTTSSGTQRLDQLVELSAGYSTVTTTNAGYHNTPAYYQASYGDSCGPPTMAPELIDQRVPGLNYSPMINYYTSAGVVDSMGNSTDQGINDTLGSNAAHPQQLHSLVAPNQEVASTTICNLSNVVDFNQSLNQSHTSAATSYGPAYE